MKPIRKQWSVLKSLDPKASDHTVILTAEVPAEDETSGDVVRCAGMECPAEVPLLAQHMKHAPDGSPTVLGKVTNFRNANIVWKGASVPAKLGDIEWADTELSRKYRQVFPAFIKDVSIGAEVVDEPKRIKGHGYDFGRTRLFELSIVTFGANPAAESMKAIKAALGDSVELPGGEDAEIDFTEIRKHIDIKLDELSSGILAVLRELRVENQTINKRLDDFESYFESRADDAEQPAAPVTPQDKTIDLSAFLAALSKAARK